MFWLVVRGVGLAEVHIREMNMAKDEHLHSVRNMMVIK